MALVVIQDNFRVRLQLRRGGGHVVTASFSLICSFVIGWNQRLKRYAHPAVLCSCFGAIDTIMVCICLKASDLLIPSKGVRKAKLFIPEKNQDETRSPQMFPCRR